VDWWIGDWWIGGQDNPGEISDKGGGVTWADA